MTQILTIIQFALFFSIIFAAASYLGNKIASTPDEAWEDKNNTFM